MRDETASRAPESMPAIASWALPVGLLVVLGPYAPIDGGLVWPLLGTLALLIVSHGRWRIVRAWVAHRGGWTAALAGLGPVRRTALLALAIAPAIVLLTVLARAAGSVLVAYPASIWALAVLGLGAPVLTRSTGRARLPVALVLAALVPLAGTWGARHEAGAEDARGWAHSGPIHGIHPFQTTAVLIDGHGPFDLPINDYVEPDGSRGYGPEALADALERALHEIARMHYANGSHRAAMAFERARVEARLDPAIREKLDEEPTDAEHPRFFVESGTWGQRSRVEFVCPGRVEQPGKPPRDNVMNKMCPDKYASEASAGLGVTGRWPGYAEGRGNERVGLSRLLGWTRSDDVRGRRVVEREIRGWAWIVLAAVGAWSLLGMGRREAPTPSRARAPTSAVSSLAGAVVLLGVVAFVLLATGSSPPRVGAFEPPPPWVDVWVLEPWLAVLMLGGALFWFDGIERPRVADGGARTGIVGAALTLVIGIVVVASHLDAVAWIRPELWPEDGGIPLEIWVSELANAIGPGAGQDILVVESAVAAIVVVALIGACAALGGSLVSVSGWIVPKTERSWLGAALVLLALLAAAGLVVSRKTHGASTLLPAAMTSTLLLGSALTLLARSEVRRERAGRAGPSIVAVLTHLGWVALAVAGVIGSARAAPAAHPFVLACAGVGLIVALGALAFVPWPTSHRDVRPGGTARDA